MCDYRIPMGFRDSRLCSNRAKWLMSYLTPDDGKAMRRTVNAGRCQIHSAERFFPKGSSRVTTIKLLDDLAAASQGGADNG